MTNRSIKMKIHFFVLILFTLCSFPSLAEVENSKNINATNAGFDIVLQKLQKNKLLRSRFTQERHLKIQTKPLLSEGQLNYFYGKGIIWEIENPVKSKVIISQNKVTEINHGSKPVSRPNLGGVYMALDALFNGNKDIINKNYTVNYTGSPKNWHIELTPKFSPLNKIFKTIEMNGEQHIKRIILNGTKQDSTVIKLVSMQVKPLSISAAEEAYFAL